MSEVLQRAREIVSSAAPQRQKAVGVFEDGGQFRIEIPSTEGPRSMEAVLQEASERGIGVHRISQGSGIHLLSDRDLQEMADMGSSASVEVSLFVGPRAGWDGMSAASISPAGQIYGWRHLDLEQVSFALADVLRACEAGIRSVLVADEGLLAVIHRARGEDHLPSDLHVKVSALMGVGNALHVQQVAAAGANSVNVRSDASSDALAEIRRLTDVPLDIYIESPDDLGGFVRYHELPAIVKAAAPIYLKFGLRNAPNVYPSGLHLEDAVVRASRERVRRAYLGLELLEREAAELSPSPIETSRIGLPTRRGGDR